MQVKGKQQPVVNVRGVGDAAPYNGGHLYACTVGRGALTPPHLAGAARPSRKPHNAPRRHEGMPVGVGVLDDPGRGGLLPDYTPISTHSNNFVRKIQRFVRSRLQGAAGYCTIIRVNVQNVPDKMTKKRPL